MNNILKIPAFQRKKAIPKQLKDLELLPLNEEFSKLTMPIVSDDDLRPAMTGNFFDLEKRKIASTDAHKLIAINMPNETFNYISEKYKDKLEKEPKGLIFHTLSQLQKDYNNVVKKAGNNPITISFEKFIQLQEIEDGRYPNYEAVTPKEFTNEINVDYQKLYWYTKVLLDAKVIDDINKIDSSNKIVYENKKIEYLKDSYMSFLNPVTKQIILTYTLDGKKEYIGFNARFLCEILKFAMEFNGKTFGKVGISGNGRAMVIELENGLNVTTNSIGLIMPVMLSDNKTIGNDGSSLDEMKTYEMYYDLDTNSIISDKENYPIDSSIGFMPNKAGVSTPKIQVMQQAPKVENNSEDLIDKKIRGLKIALKVAIKGEEKLIEKRILALEIAKKMSNPKVSVSEKMSNLDNNKIKDWYIKNYPADDLKNKLNDKNTFEDLWNGLGKNKDIYEVIGIGDSLIRERLFGHLAELKGVDYDVVYDKWLDGRETGDNVDKRNKEGMIYALQEFISAGTIANKTDYSNYDKIAEIRSKAIQYYRTNGDKQYSLGELDKVLSIVSNPNYLKIVQLYKIKNKYNKNEDINYHSENVLLLAENFGTQNDIDDAKEIIKKHEKDGHLTSENSEKRNELSERLILKARKIMAEKGVKFAKGGSVDNLLEQEIINKIQYYPKGIPPMNHKYGVRYKGKTYTSNDTDNLVEKVLLETNKMAYGGSVDGGDYVREDLNFFENGGRVWTKEQREKVAKLDKEFEEYVKEKGIQRNSYEASLLWREGGFKKRMGEIFGKEYGKYAKGGGVDDDSKFYVKSNFGNWSVIDRKDNKMVVGYSKKEDAKTTSDGLNKIDNSDELKETISILKSMKGYGHFLNNYAKGGYTRPSYKINTTGFFSFKTKDKEYIVRSSFFERKNDIEDSLQIQDELRGELGSIIISNSAWKRLSDGNTIKARSNRGNLTGRLTRVANLNENYILNKMAKGGGLIRKAPFKVGDMVYSYQNPNHKMRVAFVEDRGIEDGVDYGWGIRVALKTDANGNYDPNGSYSKTSKYMSQNSVSKTKKDSYSTGGEVNSSTQKLIEELKKNSNESITDVMTNKQGEKYRFRNWKLKYNSASNFLVKLFEKASEENTGKSYNRNFYNGDYSFYYNRPEMKNKPNGSMQMRMLEVLNTFEAGGQVEFHDYKGIEIMYEPNEKEYYANDMVFYSLEDAHEYIDSGEANKTPKHIVELYRRGMMANGGSVGSEDIYKLAEEMSEKDFRNKFLTLSKSEKDNVESLIRLGDDKKLALITILDKRDEPNNDDFYRQAYHYKGGGNVGKKDITITTYEKVVEESYGFSKIQIKNIKFIIKKIINLLSGQIESLSSGGGNAHIFVQLKDNTWIGFHNEFGDITISSPFQTFKKLTDAWNSDDWKKVTGRSLKNYKSKETFGSLVQIVSDIQDKNYDNLYKAGGDVEDDISRGKSNASDKIDFEYYAKQHAGDSWDKMTRAEKSELMSEIRENWFNNDYGKGGDVEDEKVYIDYMNKEKGFKRDRIYFDSYAEAVEWGKKNFERFNTDMINYV